MNREPYGDFDPDIKKFFKRIMWSSFLGLLWLIGFVTGGIYYKLGYVHPGIHLFQIAGFYILMATALFFLLRYLKKTWK